MGRVEKGREARSRRGNQLRGMGIWDESFYVPIESNEDIVSSSELAFTTFLLPSGAIKIGRIEQQWFGFQVQSNFGYNP